MLVRKQAGKKRKLYHFKELIIDFDYYDFKQVSLEKNGYTFKGYLYFLENPDMEKLEYINNKYENTYISKAQYRYAPEIKKTLLFVAS